MLPTSSSSVIYRMSVLLSCTILCILTFRFKGLAKLNRSDDLLAWSCISGDLTFNELISSDTFNGLFMLVTYTFSLKIDYAKTQPKYCLQARLNDHLYQWMYWNCFHFIDDEVCLGTVITLTVCVLRASEGRVRAPHSLKEQIMNSRIHFIAYPFGVYHNNAGKIRH